MKTWAILAGFGAAASGLVGADGYRAEVRLAEDGVAVVYFEGAPRLARGGDAGADLVAAQAALFDGQWSVSRGGGVAAWSGETVLDATPVEILPGVWMRRVDDSSTTARYEIRLDDPDALSDGEGLAPLAGRVGAICFDLPEAPDVAAPAGLSSDDGGACLATGPISGERRLVVMAQAG